MAIGYILCAFDKRKESESQYDLKNLDEVKEIHPLFGEYDIIAKIEATDYVEIEKIVKEKIRNIDGVNDTMTLIGKG